MTMWKSKLKTIPFIGPSLYHSTPSKGGLLLTYAWLYPHPLEE